MSSNKEKALDLLDKAGYQPTDDPAAAALVYATLALVEVQERVTEQARIGNKLQVALVDQLSEIAQYIPPMSAAMDPRILLRDYLTADEWAELDL